jgi:hypothetical protein
MIKGEHFLRQTGPLCRKMLCAEFINNQQTMLASRREQTCQKRHGPCEDESAKRATSQNATIQPGFRFAMLSNGRPEQPVEDGVVADAKPACVALVPVIPVTPWSRVSHLEPSRPNSIFVTHLIATAEQVPQTPYQARQHQVLGAGARMRQII